MTKNTSAGLTGFVTPSLQQEAQRVHVGIFFLHLQQSAGWLLREGSFVKISPKKNSQLGKIKHFF